MVEFSNAKINLGLNILEQRGDGYHNIETCFYPVPYSDILEIIPSDETSFSQSGISIPGRPEENSCLAAYNHLQKSFDLPPVQIHLHKLVPTGAGLGGGSSDAACCLVMLNRQFELGLANHELETIASQIGSDCAFFVQNRPQIGLEKGNRLVPIELSLSGYYLVIVTPQIQISSAQAYSKVASRLRATDLSTTLTNSPIQQWKDLVFNDFEPSVFEAYPAIAQIKDQLYQHGALFSLLSGSGSSVFGIFANEPNLSFDQHALVWQTCL